jgi:hypothetical protein
MSNGKGDSPRPMTIPYDKYVDNWDAIFKKKTPKVKKPKKQK